MTGYKLDQNVEGLLFLEENGTRHISEIAHSSTDVWFDKGIRLPRIGRPLRGRVVRKRKLNEPYFDSLQIIEYADGRISSAYILCVGEEITNKYFRNLNASKIDALLKIKPTVAINLDGTQSQV